MKAHLPLECWRWQDHCWAHCPSCWKHWQWACTLRTVQGPARWQESSSQGKKVFCGHPKSCWAPTNFVSSTSEPVRGKWWQTGMKDTFEQIAHSGWKEEKDRDRQKTLRSGNSFLAFLFNEADVRNKASYLNCESETWLFFFFTNHFKQKYQLISITLSPSYSQNGDASVCTCRNLIVEVV